jgi:AraC family transcriptional regulator of adaptative response/methylated-DNA-[protein]-cysteine methyltransferase
MRSDTKQNQTAPLIGSHLQTPLGTMLAVADETHLHILKFIDQNNLQKSVETLEKAIGAKTIIGSNNLIKKLERELTEYFNGALQTFSTPTQLLGTQFQQKSWDALTKIPYGRTTSYGQQAIAVGNAKAYRAVANANRNNPIAIIIPCHRIIKSNGNLCGYNGGIHRKQALLELEKMNSSYHIKSI